MKSKITLLVVLLFAGLVSLQAQPGQRRTVEERVKQSIDRVKDSLKLSENQIPEINAAYTQYYMAFDQLRSGLQPGQRPDRTSVDKLEEIRDGKLKLILNESQFTKFKELEAAMRQRGQRPQGNN